MKFGAHISIAESITKVPQRAAKIGCECFQFFTRPPQGGKGKLLTPNLVKNFKKECKKYKFKDWYIHAPYFINFASVNNQIRHGSVSVLREDLEKGTLLGAKYVMVHLGSATDQIKLLGEIKGKQKALQMAVVGLQRVLDGYKGTCQLLIEISAGAGKIIGDRFEEIAKIIKQSSKAIPNNLRNILEIGVCFDTAHVFESGYDLRTEQAVKKTLTQFDKTIGLKKLKLIHANDSKTDLGTHIDRHAHIGKGKIGLAGFRALVLEPRLKNINMIIETPYSLKRDIQNLKTLKKLRNYLRQLE